MPKIADVFDTKPKGKVRDDVPTNSQTLDTKPKGLINDDDFNEGETVNSIMTVGAWMGSPFITYTVAGTATFTQPKGGKAG